MEIHKRKPSYGCRRINAILRREIGWIVSDTLVHKVCKTIHVRSHAKHYRVYKEKGDESILYPNLLNNDWRAEFPFQKITSDTTMIYFKGKRYDWTYYVDAFDRSIIGSNVKALYYGANPQNHKLALEDMLQNKIKRGILINRRVYSFYYS